MGQKQLEQDKHMSAKSVKAAQEGKFPEPALPRTFELVDGVLTFPRVEAFKQEYDALCRKYQLAFVHQSHGEFSDGIEVEELSNAATGTFNLAVVSDDVFECKAGFQRRNRENEALYLARNALEKEQKAAKAKDTALRKARKAEKLLLTEGVTLSKGHYRLVRVDDVTGTSEAEVTTPKGVGR